MLSESDATFRSSIQATYDSFRPRIVDIALQKANWKILAETGWEEEQACLDAYGFGTRYIDSHCVNMYVFAVSVPTPFLDVC